MVEPINWEGAWKLEDYVIDLFKKKMTDSPELKILIRFYGRDKIAEIWKRFRASHIPGTASQTDRLD